MRHAKVSVVSPCFNHGTYLPEAVQSVYEQTLPAHEIIVVDDGSTDAPTIDVLRGMEGGKARVVRRSHAGPSAARNAGIREASGEYILPLDADDRISARFIEATTAVLDADSAVGIAYPETMLFGEAEGRLPVDDYGFPAILLGNTIVNTSLYRRADWEAARGYDEKLLHGWEDYDLWLSIIELGRRVVRVPEAVLHYRQIVGSRSARLSGEQAIACHAEIFKNHVRLYAEHGEVLFRELRRLRADLAAERTKLAAERTQLAAEMSRHYATGAQLAALSSAARRSRVLKLRNACLRLAMALGLKVDKDELLP